MTIALYMDHHVPRAITVGLCLRGVDVITAYEDGTSKLDDSALLDRASELGRVLFTRDDDLLAKLPLDRKIRYHLLASFLLINYEFLRSYAVALWTPELIQGSPQLRGMARINTGVHRQFLPNCVTPMHNWNYSKSRRGEATRIDAVETNKRCSE